MRGCGRRIIMMMSMAMNATSGLRSSLRPNTGGMTSRQRARKGSQRSRRAEKGWRSQGMLGNQESSTPTSSTSRYTPSHRTAADMAAATGARRGARLTLRRPASSAESGDDSSPPSAVAAADASAAARGGGDRRRPRGAGRAGKARVLGSARADGLGSARSSGARGHGEVRRPYISPLHRRPGSGPLEISRSVWEGGRGRGRAEGGRRKATDAAAVPREEEDMVLRSRKVGPACKREICCGSGHGPLTITKAGGPYREFKISIPQAHTVPTDGENENGKNITLRSNQIQLEYLHTACLCCVSGSLPSSARAASVVQ
jgi:hypothetical protein